MNAFINCLRRAAQAAFGAVIVVINHAEGFLFRKAVEGRPKPIVLIGIWIIFFPVLILSLYCATQLILNRARALDFFFFWAFIGFVYVASVVLYRVTKNYLSPPSEED